MKSPFLLLQSLKYWSLKLTAIRRGTQVCWMYQQGKCFHAEKCRRLAQERQGTVDWCFNHEKWWFHGIQPTKTMILMGFNYAKWWFFMAFNQPKMGCNHPGKEFRIKPTEMVAFLPRNMSFKHLELGFKQKIR